MTDIHSKETISELKLMGVDQKNFLRILFSDDAMVTGTTDMATTADEYFILPASGDIYVIEKIKIIVEDDGDFPNEEFAALGSALTNGINFKLIQGSVSSYNAFSDLLGGWTLKQNSDFASLGELTYSIDVTGTSVLVCEINFPKELGYPLMLNGDTDFGILLETQDDMSNLERMYVIASGITQSSRTV